MLKTESCCYTYGLPVATLSGQKLATVSSNITYLSELNLRHFQRCEEEFWRVNAARTFVVAPPTGSNIPVSIAVVYLLFYRLYNVCRAWSSTHEVGILIVVKNHQDTSKYFSDGFLFSTSVNSS